MHFHLSLKWCGAWKWVCRLCGGEDRCVCVCVCVCTQVCLLSFRCVWACACVHSLLWTCLCVYVSVCGMCQSLCKLRLWVCVCVCWHIEHMVWSDAVWLWLVRKPKWSMQWKHSTWTEYAQVHQLCCAARSKKTHGHAFFCRPNQTCWDCYSEMSH